MSKDLFNAVDMDDIPKELKQQLNKKRLLKNKIMSLLQEAMSVTNNVGVTVDQILVAYYREYGEVVTRRSMLSHLARLKQVGKIKKINNRYVVDKYSKRGGE